MDIKKRLPIAVLTGAALGFTYLFFGIIEIYSGNKAEFTFRLKDFALYILLITAAVSLMVTVLLTLLKGKYFMVVFGILFWAAVMGYIQGSFLNKGVNSLTSDDVGSMISVGRIIINAVVWLAAGVGCVIGALKMKKHTIIKTIATVMLVIVVGMQFVGCISSVIGPDKTESKPEKPEITTPLSTTDGQDVSTLENPEPSTQSSQPVPTQQPPRETEKPETPDKPEKGKYILSTKGMYEVSGGKNVIVFIIDRFDVSYYQDIIKDDPDFFNSLDGFTYYNDNLALYSRTYPAVTTMLTGTDTDFLTTADEYFDTAYANSPFLKDLKENDYKIKIYSGSYYTYRDARSLYGIADNVLPADGYSITDRGKLITGLMSLSAYRCAPLVLKSAVRISSSSFNGVVKYNDVSPVYEIDDVKVYAGLRENGLSVDGNGNSFIYIHLNGCHAPYNMDEDGNYVEAEGGGDVKGALRGNFRMIYMYINELKRLGLYEDSTIIITGDHPRARNDGAEPAEPRVTALFVKESGKSGEPLGYSSAQVSQSNFIPTVIKSSGIKTNNSYGQAYGEVPEGAVMKRTNKFQLSTDGTCYIIEYEITGNGNDFSNWKEVSRKDIGYLYK